jgi:uncharacterized membrane protein
MDDRYRILYTGDLMPGRELDDVVPKLAATFKLPHEKARELIVSGAGRVLKQDVSAADANRYREALATVGLKVVIEPPIASPGGTPAAAAQRASNAPVPPAGDSREARASKADGTPDVSRCPKCGADAVSELTGVCQACGVVVERYLANHGLAPPSAPPLAAVPTAATPPVATRSKGSTEATTMAPRAVPAGHGWLWITQAWGLFKQQPGAWIGALVVFYLIMIGVSLVPLIGGLAASILTPMLSGGLMIGAHRQSRGERFEIGHLFAGISQRGKPLALVGLVYLLAALGIGIVIALLLFGMMAGVSGSIDPTAMDADALGFLVTNPLVLLVVLIAMLLGIPLAMAMFFAPSLVALDEVPVLQAFRLSLVGCLKNILPFLLYGIVAVVLVVVGSIPLMLGLLVVIPLLTIAIYTAYRDIFHSGR